jgi:hypothetical protein
MGRKAPKTAAEILVGMEPAGANDGPGPWPPHGWFSHAGVESGSGRPFDWTAPPAGFGPEAARDWIDRAIRMQRYYLDKEGRSPSYWNDRRGSALGNAHLMIENLSSRRASPAFPRRLYRGPMDELTGDQELQELTVIRDWLETVVARIERAGWEQEEAGKRRSRRSRAPRLRTAWRLGHIFLDGKRYDEKVDVCLYFEAMIRLRDWKSRELIAEKMKELVAGLEEFRGVRFSRPDRIQKGIKHKVLVGLIASVSGTGTRVKPEYLE